MWIVVLALRRPYTFVIMALLFLILGGVAIDRMSTDIFPEIDIPVVAVIWTYNGLPADEMESRITTVFERAVTTTVNDVEHIESQSLRGVSVIKIYFQPKADVNAAQAQVTSLAQTLLRPLPPGITPPGIIRYRATTVPVLQASISSDSLPESQVYDLGANFLRTQLATIQGASVLQPLGGTTRQVMVDINPQDLYAHGISAIDVSNALNAQNLILPAGTAKMGETEFDVRLNSSPNLVDSLNDLPIKEINGNMIFMRDVAQIRDGGAIQTNIVRQDGKRGALMPIYKSGDASTLDIVSRVKARLPQIKAGLPESFKIQPLFDQSVFVRAAVQGVLTEGGIAACLTAAMILLFLGSWRSTLIVTVSIPLSIMVSIICLAVLGYSLNTMTLGGLALAVGILVDDATVEIENIHRNLREGKPIKRAILDGAQQVAVPAFVATISICIVFLPILFISGAAGYLFTPLALAVVFALLASYLLSRTLIPTMVVYLLSSEMELYKEEENPHHGKNDKSNHLQAVKNDHNGNGHEAKNGNSVSREENRSDAATANGNTQPQQGANGNNKTNRKADQKPKKSKSKAANNPIWRVHRVFEKYFDRFVEGYRRHLDWALTHRLIVTGIFGVIVVCSLILLPFIGENFFPSVDSGQIRLHLRVPTRMRVEETERITGQVEDEIRKTIPPDQIETIISNIGLSANLLYVAYSDGSTVGSMDAEILVALKENHTATAGYVKQLRQSLPQTFPDCTFFFQPADIVTQILNFGIPSPIDIQVTGPTRNRDGNYQVAKEIAARVRNVPGTADVHLHQIMDVPVMRVNVDRSRAGEIGLTQNDVARNLLLNLSGSGQTAPNFFLNQNGVSYQVAVQTPQNRIDSVDSLLNTPVSSGTNATKPQLLNNLATVSRETAPAVVNHYNVQPTFDIYANTQDRDLGGVSRDVNKIIKELTEKLPPGSTINVRGQVESMNSSFLALGIGLIFSIVLAYALMVVNFQSWSDPFIILMALPGALSGILWMLFVTQTTFSVPALMGAIMCVGVATSNSILMVTFANDARKEGLDSREAALEAGTTRLRPVIMTALAMIIGMLPMSLGLGEGGEQNAPLGRAVIGGLLVATVTTLFLVPVVYSRLRVNAPVEYSEKDEEDEEQQQEASEKSKTPANQPQTSAA